MAKFSISFDDIQQAAANLKYRPGSVKFQAVSAILSVYSSAQEAGETVRVIDTDALVDQIWDLNHDPARIRSKRRNFSSLKSSINKDLEKLSQKGLNPDHIIISPANVFDMSEEAKNDVFNSLGDAAGAGFDLEQISGVLKAVSQALESLKEADSDTESEDIIKEIEKIISHVSRGGALGDLGAGRGAGDGGGDNEYDDADEDEVKIVDADEALEKAALAEDDAYEEIEDEDAEIIDADEDIEEIELDEDQALEEIGDDDVEIVDSDEDIEEIELGEDEELEEIDDEDAEIIDDEDIEEIESGEDEALEEIEDDDVEILDSDEDIEEIELDEDEELEEVAGDDVEILDSDEDIEEIELDEDEELEEVAGDDVEILDSDEDIEEIELDEDEELEEVAGDDVEILDSDEDIEEIELDEDEELEEAAGDDVEILDSDEDIEEIELDEDEELEEAAGDDVEILDSDEDIEEIELGEDEDLEEIDAEDTEIVDDEDIDEIESGEGEALEEVEDTDDADVEELELDEDEELAEIEDLDDDVEEIELDEDEELEEVDELDEEEQKALEAFREQRERAEQFDETLGDREKKFNIYVTVPQGLYTVGTQKRLKASLELQQLHMPKTFIGKFPVTNALFEIFADHTGYVTTAERRGYGTVFYARFKKGKTRAAWQKSAGSQAVKGACWFQPSGPESSLHGKRNHPVVQVSVEDAMAYASWIGRRLPTEAEWEAAARTDMGNRYPWGSEFNPKALNFELTALADTCPVDEYEAFANEFGMADILGNVMEWTGDVQNPPVKTKASRLYSIAKGGGWNCGPDVTIGSRGLFPSGFSANTIGFRCISELFL